MPSSLVRKVDVVWSGLPGAPYYTQFFFGHEPGSATASAAAVRTFLLALVNMHVTPLVAQIRPDQVIIDTATGKPTATETGAAQAQVPFAGTGDPLPYMTQVLIRMKTGLYNNGHRLQGRIYIPGCREASNIGGVITATDLTNYNTAAAALISGTASTGKWAIWSRKYKSWGSIDSASAWSEWSVQRSRRL